MYLCFGQVSFVEFRTFDESVTARGDDPFSRIDYNSGSLREASPPLENSGSVLPFVFLPAADFECLEKVEVLLLPPPARSPREASV